MKIKTKKQLNLPQLIEWAWENGIKNKIIRADKQLMNIQFDEHGDFKTYGFTGIDTTFTVEVEEDVTEDTVIPKMLEMYRDATSNFGAEIYINQSINSVIENAEVLTLHIVNDDGTHTLIWRDGKLEE
ncbi:hypothetical protein K2V65_08575 [Staphylococcus gallinarum]|jgi:hypothetical protein|uniref:hypothetical protein n=1 Tax=Staphylococcus gallinarum TaxID=1293 RepID=UPI001E5F2C02|nr:hypothetical protein [Staphylococcus gallinarum]MCD8786682.1 hypothetical protein [Staphylococcus gallinarum]MCD8859273.1 hypothetical protein [Staphylococcus gallinarum]